jgi:hypothetical protein
MLSQNQVQQLFIGKSGAINPGAVNIAPSAMTVGEIGLFTRGGNKYTEANDATGADFVIYKKMADGSTLKSETLNLSMVEKVIRKVGSAAAEKAEAFGYTGSTGSIETLDETMYRINITYKEGFAHNDHGVGYAKHAIYKSDASATQAEIAIGLAKSGISNFSREPKNSSGDAPIKFKAVSNVALASDFVFDATFEITGTKGSDTLLVAAATPTYNTGTVLAVGDYLRIGTAAGATGAAVALLSDVYKVISLPSTTTVKLDRPLQTASGSYLIADGSITVVTAALGNAADWGVVLTGQEQDFTVGKKGYKKVDWESSIEGTDNTTKTSLTSVSAGINVYEQIAEMEWFLQGNEGNFYRASYPIMENPRSEVEDLLYDTIEIIYNTNVPGLINTTPNRKVVTLAIPNTTPNYAATGTANDITDILETLLTGAKIYGGASTVNGGALAAGDLDL